jgi:hypothetical protein
MGLSSKIGKKWAAIADVQVSTDPDAMFDRSKS